MTESAPNWNIIKWASHVGWVSRIVIRRINFLWRNSPFFKLPLIRKDTETLAPLQNNSGTVSFRIFYLLSTIPNLCQCWLRGLLVYRSYFNSIECLKHPWLYDISLKSTVDPNIFPPTHCCHSLRTYLRFLMLRVIRIRSTYLCCHKRNKRTATFRSSLNKIFIMPRQTKSVKITHILDIFNQVR